MILFLLGFLLGIAFVLVGLGLWIAHSVGEMERKR